MNRLFRERGGRSALDIVTQLRIEDYATAQIQLGKVTRRLETLGAVSTEGRKRSSLVDTYNVFSARVERLAAELPPPRQSPGTSSADYTTLSTEQLIDETSTILRQLLEWDTEQRAAVVSATAAPTSGEMEMPTPSAAPEPRCEFCGQTHTRCAEIKLTRVETWETLHWLDPSEVKKRDEYQTKVMYAMVGRPLLI